MVYEFVECFAAPDPAPHLTPEKRADLLEGLGALRVVLPGHRPVHLAQRVLTRRWHPPRRGPGSIVLLQPLSFVRP